MDLLTQAQTEFASIDDQIAALQKRKGELRVFIELAAKLFSENTAIRNEFVHGHVTKGALTLAHEEMTRANARRMWSFTSDGTKVRINADRDRAFATQKEMVLTKAREIISVMGFMTTKDLIEYIEAHGNKIGGSDKTLTVSSILSRSDEFENDRLKGWSLKEGPKEETPQDAGTSAGSDLRVDQPELPMEGTGTTPDRRGKEGTDDA